MPAANANWTIDLLDALPDSVERHEIIDGELFVTPAPGEEHQFVLLDLATLLREYARKVGIGKGTISPSDVWWGDRQRNRVQPDTFVLRVLDGVIPPYPYHMKDLLLAVEVVSPGNPLLDYQRKRDLYLREGVPEYWVVNVEARNVSRWRGRDDPGEVLSGRLEWHPEGAAEPFILDLPDFFDKALR